MARKFPSRRRREPLHFFKIILPSSVRDKKLLMPNKFARMYGHELSATASLALPNGSVWEVGLDKTNDQIWFSDGWANFSDYHSIAFGHLLVFKYEGNSSFQVLIFDTTASEIQYPPGDGSGIAISEPQRRNKNRRKHETNRYQTRSNKCRVEESIKIEESDGGSDPRQTLPSSTRGDHRAIRAPERFKTKNPSFMAIMRGANITKSYLHIPSAFSSKYLSRQRVVKLQAASSGQQWEVECYFCGTSATRRTGRGWMAFARENGMKVGDVIVFELVNSRRKNLLEFTVFSDK